MIDLQEVVDGALDGFERAEERRSKLTEAILNQDGALDLTNKNGREYATQIKEQRDATVTAAKAAYDAAGGLENEAEAERGGGQGCRRNSMADFIAMSAELGIGDEKARELAAGMGFIPSEVTSQISIETKKAGIDLEKFRVDEQGQVIGMNVEPGTEVAADIIDQFKRDDHGNLLMPLDPNTPEADRQLGSFVKNHEGTIIGFQAKAIIAPAQESLDGLIRDAEGKPIGMQIDAKTVQAGADLSKFILDAEGKPIAIKIDPADKEGTQIIDDWIVDNNGKRIAMSMDPLNNNPTAIVEGWIETDHGRYNVFGDPNTETVKNDIDAWTKANSPKSEQNTYQVHPNINTADADAGVKSWIEGVNGAPGAYTYEVHPNTNSGKEDGSESNSQVGSWIEFNDGKHREFSFTPTRMRRRMK